MQLEADRLADIVSRAIEIAVDPMLERIAVAEARLEMKTAELVPVLAALGELTKEQALLRERVAVVETRKPEAGPPGPQGPPGLDGKDGTPGLRYQDVWEYGKSYTLGDVVTWGGSSWHCNEATDSKPGEGAKSWTLMVKRGRDGKDAK